VTGDFASVAHAKRAAIDTATTNPSFKDWCVALEIEDDTGTIVATWRKES
jgi:hypothetical protein